MEGSLDKQAGVSRPREEFGFILWIIEAQRLLL